MLKRIKSNKELLSFKQPYGNFLSLSLRIGGEIDLSKKVYLKSHRIDEHCIGFSPSIAEDIFNDYIHVHINDDEIISYFAPQCNAVDLVRPVNKKLTGRLHLKSILNCQFIDIGVILLNLKLD